MSPSLESDRSQTTTPKRKLGAFENALIVAALPLVERIARRVKRRKLRSADLEELVTSGRDGLVAAALAFRPILVKLDHRSDFERFAQEHIVGAMLTGFVRARRLEKWMMLIDCAEMELAAERSDRMDDRGLHPRSWGAGGSVEEDMAALEMEERVRDVQRSLPEDEQRFVELRFHQGLDLKATAEQMGKTYKQARGFQEKLFGKLREALA